jgi:multidrug efflux system membrane fusion protein
MSPPPLIAKSAWSGGLILCIALLISSACTRQGATSSPTAPPPQAVRAVQATTADVPLEIAALGTVEANSTVEVKARVTAPITRVHFAEGQDVQQGQLLFDLDPEVFRRQLAQIEANIARDAALAKQAEANINRDVAQAKNLEAIAARSLKLQQEGILSREQTEQARTAADSAGAAVQSSRAALESAKAAETADRAHFNETRLLLDYTRIYAPITGRAGVISTKVGSLAKQNDNTLVTLLETAPVQVAFSIPENLLPQIRQYQSRQPLAITALPEGQRAVTGQLHFIDNTVDPTTGGIKLKARFANATQALWPGQFVNVKAELTVEKARVLVAAQAVQTGPQGKFVWILDPATSTVAMREVTLARMLNTGQPNEQAVISTGLATGESVISEGQKRLMPGVKIRLLPPAAAAVGKT